MWIKEIQSKIDRVDKAVDKKYTLNESRRAYLQQRIATLNKDTCKMLGIEPVVYDDDMQVLAQRLSDAKKVYYENGNDHEDAMKIYYGPVDTTDEGAVRTRAWHSYYWAIDLLNSIAEAVMKDETAIEKKEKTRKKYLDQLREVGGEDVHCIATRIVRVIRYADGSCEETKEDDWYPVWYATEQLDKLRSRKKKHRLVGCEVSMDVRNNDRGRKQLAYQYVIRICPVGKVA